MTTTSLTGDHCVASGHPLAARAGLDALRRGGSAVDAVLAMAFTQWAVNGPLCGPGGDMFVMVADNAGVTVFGGWSRTPLTFPVAGPIESSGPRGAVVPGALAGASAAWRSGGRTAWAELFAPAIDHAAGHEVTPWMQRSYATVVAKGHGAALAGFLDQTAAPVAGDTVSCSRFGRTLEQIAAGGADEFYRGTLGEQLVAASRADGGYLTVDDLVKMQAAEGPADVHEIADLTVALPPSPSQAGITARLIAASYPDEAAESRSYAEATATIVERELTARCVVGVPGTAASVASDGQAVAVVVHSLAGVQFGTGWVAGDTGVAFGNRVGTALSTREDLPAANPVPGGVLPHTLSAMFLRRGRRSMMIATPGGDRQVQWLAQSAQRFRQDERVDGIVARPRWFVCPEGDRFGVPGGIGKEWFAFAEPDIEWEHDDRVAGYAVCRTDSVGGGLQAIDCTDGVWSAASDPRSGGTALAEGSADV